MRLSIVLAVYNEEENLGRCLESVKNLADEMVVVDGGSKDRTIEIAKKFRARIISTDNPPIFHINKQKAIDASTGDWILQLDADEAVSKELEEEIRATLSKNPKENGFWMPRKNWFLGRFLMKGGQYPDYTLRLYRRGKGRLPQKSVHEQAEVDGAVGYLKQPLLHYPYKNFIVYIFKWNRYNILFAKEIKEKLKGKNDLVHIVTGVNLFLVKPVYWFLLTYIRHKGFMDSWQGFVFSFFSALRFPVSFVMFYAHRNSDHS